MHAAHRCGGLSDTLRGLKKINFEASLKEVLEHEGGFVDHELDRGGKTRYGITESVARDHGFTGKIRDLPMETAEKIYRKSYWDAIRLDELKNGRLRYIVFDTAVHMGPSAAVRKLQTTYNLLSSREITVDGIIGPETLGAVNSYQHGLDTFKFVYCVMRGEKYFDIVRTDGGQSIFIRGWMRRLMEVSCDLDREFTVKECTVDGAVDLLADKIKDMLGGES